MRSVFDAAFALRCLPDHSSGVMHHVADRRSHGMSKGMKGLSFNCASPWTDDSATPAESNGWLQGRGSGTLYGDGMYCAAGPSVNK